MPHSSWCCNLAHHPRRGPRAAGIVHWQPPPRALARAAEMANDPSVSSYGPDEGLPALREALRHKIRQENGLQGVRCCCRCWAV